MTRVSIILYSFPNNLFEADPHGYLRELWHTLSLCHPRILSAWVEPGFCCSPGRSFRAGRPGPLTSHISTRRAAAQTAPTAIIIMGLQGKSSPRGHRDTRTPARFFRFPRGPPYSFFRMQKKKKRMRLFMLYAGGRGGAAS